MTAIKKIYHRFGKDERNRVGKLCKVTKNKWCHDKTQKYLAFLAFVIHMPKIRVNGCSHAIAIMLDCDTKHTHTKGLFLVGFFRCRCRLNAKYFVETGEREPVPSDCIRWWCVCSDYGVSVITKLTNSRVYKASLTSNKTKALQAIFTRSVFFFASSRIFFLFPLPWFLLVLSMCVCARFFLLF